MTTLDAYDLQVIRRVVALLQDDAEFLDREHNRAASEMRQHVLAVVSRLKKRHSDAMKQARLCGDGCAYSEPVAAIPPACCESCTGDDADGTPPEHGDPRPYDTRA